MAAVRPRRSDRSGRSARPSRRTLAVVLGCVAVLGIASVAFGLYGNASSDDGVTTPSVAPQPAADDTAMAAQSSETAHVAAAMVEVPAVTEMRLSDAKVVLKAAGLNAVIASGEASDTGSDAVVAEQEPPAGERVEGHSDVTLVLAKPKPKATQKSAPEPTAAWVVCIDPGHQARGDSGQEPVGPGSSQTKARVTGGATGIKTGIPEYELALQIATNLKQRLESKGVKVVMTRTTNDVSLSNSERAKIAQKADADLFVRIHCDGSTDQKMSGASTLYPASNRWTSGFAAESKQAASRVQRALVAATGAVDRGTKARGDLSGFNWATQPALLVECGFLSNPVEDRLLASPHYQDKVASGIVAGVIEHLEAAR